MKYSHTSIYTSIKEVLHDNSGRQKKQDIKNSKYEFTFITIFWICDVQAGQNSQETPGTSCKGFKLADNSASVHIFSSVQ